MIPTRTMTASQKPTEMLVALAGNPNSGKTSLFNTLTGAHQHVGNYPGVTVEKVEGRVLHAGHSIRIVDLPGIYSLTSYSLEETIARTFLVTEKPDVVVNVVDATNLERNLYLTVQLLEMGVRVIVVLNMMDELKERGIVLDTDTISRRIECPVVETIASKGVGIDRLMERILEARGNPWPIPTVNYLNELGREIETLIPLVKAFDGIPFHAQFAAMKLLENDEDVTRLFRNKPETGELFARVDRSIRRLEIVTGYPPQVLIGDRRYGFASGVTREATVSKPLIDRISLTEKIDTVVTHRVLGIPFFLLTMYAVFFMTFNLGEIPMQWIESALALFSDRIGMWWMPDRLPLLRSLFLDGIVGGVGGVIAFLPNIVLLFIGIAFLEDTGYMARIAFIMDKVMMKIGLHGRSFIPLIIGFGCTVPAIMATRTIRSERTRLTTIMILPLMSCGARLTIYLLIIPAFFPAELRATVLWLLYLTGILLALLIARILRKTLFRGDAEPFVMELPPYRLPSVRSVLIHMWERSWMYLQKAGTIILAVSILLWGLLTFPVRTSFDVDQKIAAGEQIPEGDVERMRSAERLEYSLAGRIGMLMEPAIRPMGFDWRIGTAFIGAIAAKELFVAQIGIVFSLGSGIEHGDALRNLLRKEYAPLTGLSMALFALIALPCSATIAVTRRESGSWKWAFFQWAGLTVIGWIVATTVYQVGTLTGIMV